MQNSSDTLTAIRCYVVVLLESIEDVGRAGEEAFARICNEWRCEYLHISQDRDDKLSSEMFSNNEKRPDFMVNVTDIGPMFFEVKTFTPKHFSHGGADRIESFRENYLHFDKLRNFADAMKTSTWYAFIRKSGGHIDDSTVYLCPLSRVIRWDPRDKVSQSPSWTFVSIPLSCTNECNKAKLDLSDKCLLCVNRLCQKPWV